MTTIQTARYEQFTRRLLRLVGGSIMPRLQNDLSPVINIEDPADDALLFWKGHRLASGRATGTSDAAEFASCSLFNPLGSGSLVWVRQILSNINTRTIRLSLTQSRTAAVQGTLFFSDGRASVTSVPKAELGFDSLAALPTLTGWRQICNSGISVPIRPRFVLSPGVGLQVTDEGTNQGLTVSFEWIERAAETSELEGA